MYHCSIQHILSGYTYFGQSQTCQTIPWTLRQLSDLPHFSFGRTQQSTKGRHREILLTFSFTWTHPPLGQPTPSAVRIDVAGAVEHLNLKQYAYPAVGCLGFDSQWICSPKSKYTSIPGFILIFMIKVYKGDDQFVDVRDFQRWTLQWLRPAEIHRTLRP